MILLAVRPKEIIEEYGVCKRKLFSNYIQIKVKIKVKITLLADLGRRRGRRKRCSGAGRPGRPPPQSGRPPRTAGGTFQTPPLPSPTGSNKE